MPVVADPDVHRWTVDEYERLVTMLDLDHVELIDGVVFDVSPESPVHADATDAVYQLLRTRHHEERVRRTGSVRFDDGSIWEPDVYVTSDQEFSSCPQAGDVTLVVEVAVSTWHRDIEAKLPEYLRTGIPEAWVLRPTVENAWELVRFTDPGGEHYRSMTTIPLPDGPGTIQI